MKCLLIWVFVFLFEVESSFSGFFHPSVRSDHYAASWIAPLRMFLGAKKEMFDICNLEGATHSLLKRNRPTVLMARDYMDFFVEHLSSLVNQLPDDSSDQFLMREMSQKGTHLKKWISSNNPLLSPFANDTIAVMPFSLHTYRHNEFPRMRKLFFELTYLSVYSNFPKIVVAVPDEHHLDILLNRIRIPTPFHVLKCYAQNGTEIHDYDLMKCMMIQLRDNLENAEPGSMWRGFSRVYFTECDQILHMRARQEIHDAASAATADLLLIPHRMNTLLLPKVIAERSWEGAKSLENVTLITEDFVIPRGSCCEDGRYVVVKDCGNFWYNCEEVYTEIDRTWMRFGIHGFPMPCATEHLAKCVYSETKRLCDVPGNCKKRVPVDMTEMCREQSKWQNVLDPERRKAEG